MKQLVHAEVRSFFSYAGPIPPPDLIRGYEDVQPGAADRILKVFESQSQHRQQLESQGLANAIEAQRRGSRMAFTITLVCTVMGGFLVYSGKDLSGFGVFFTAVGAMVANLAMEKFRGRKELADKRQGIERPSGTP